VQRKRGANHIAGTNGSAGSGGWDWIRGCAGGRLGTDVDVLEDALDAWTANFHPTSPHFIAKRDALSPRHDALSSHLLPTSDMLRD